MAGFKRPVPAGLGLPRAAHRVQGRQAGPGALAPWRYAASSEELARKFIGVQRKQFKRLGVFGDWEHPYLTLDSRLRGRESCAPSVGKFVDQGDSCTRARNPCIGPPARARRWPRRKLNTRRRTRPRSTSNSCSPAARWRARRVWSSGRRLPGRCPPNLAVAVNPGFGYRAQAYK